MVKVTRKDDKEANENLVRRFNRKVLQSGVIAAKKNSQRVQRKISKTERRKAAIIAKQRREEKTRKIKLGLR